MNEDMTDNEISDAIESGKLFSAKSVMLEDREQQMILLKSIENRHQDIIKLEKSIIELHELFNDIASLVENQGEMLNVIEINVACAADVVERARRNMHQAKEMTDRHIKVGRATF